MLLEIYLCHPPNKVVSKFRVWRKSNPYQFKSKAVHRTSRKSLQFYYPVKNLYRALPSDIVGGPWSLIGEP